MMTPAACIGKADATDRPPDPDLYAWHDMPADPRDRAAVVRMAASRGIRPAWADRTLSPWERIQSRLDRLERAAEAIASRLVAGGAA